MDARLIIPKINPWGIETIDELNFAIELLCTSVETVELIDKFGTSEERALVKKAINKPVKGSMRSIKSISMKEWWLCDPDYDKFEYIVAMDNGDTVEFMQEDSIATFARVKINGEDVEFKDVPKVAIIGLLNVYYKHLFDMYFGTFEDKGPFE